MMEIVKEEGLDNITAEVCPHHFILTSDDIKCDDPNYKMNPPLRTKKDVDALIRGLKDGSFKVISTALSGMWLLALWELRQALHCLILHL